MNNIKAWLENFRQMVLRIKDNKTQSLVIYALLFVLTTVAGNLIGKASESFFPKTDDSALIIENQNKQFDLVKENLQKLQSSISGQDRTYLNAVTDTIKDLKSESDNLVVRLAALQNENSNLKQTLKSTKGVYGGVDVIVPDNSVFKIDSQTSFGFSNAYGGSGFLTLTGANKDENVLRKNVDAGEGVYFTNENNKACSVVFGGKTNVIGSNAVAGNFIIACKK